MPSAGDLSKAAGDRFSIVSAFPAAVVVFYVFALLRTGAFSGNPHLPNLVPQQGEPTAGVVLLLVIAVFIAAVLLQPFQLGLVRLLEGYWGTGRVGSTLAQLLVGPRLTWLKRHRKAAQEEPPLPDLAGRLHSQISALRVYQRDLRKHDRGRTIADRYPNDDKRVMPTALGNALRAFEDTAGERYGLDTIAAFRRLHPLMSPPLEKSYATHRIQLDAAAGLCVAFVVITGVSIPAFAHAPWWLFVPATTALLAYLTYRGAMTSASAMGRVVVTAFDLHRHDLLAALHYPLPPDAALEFAFNARLSAWFRGGFEEDSFDKPPKAPRRMFADYVHDHAAAPGDEYSHSDPGEPDAASDTE